MKRFYLCALDIKVSRDCDLRGIHHNTRANPRWATHISDPKPLPGGVRPSSALMPAHRVYIESHLGKGTIVKRKPASQSNIGIDAKAAAIDRFSCYYRVELVHGCCHDYL